MITNISKAMKEQAEAAGQITAAADSMRAQTDQVAKAMTEQTRAIKDMSDGAREVSQTDCLITRANREHSTSRRRYSTGCRRSGRSPSATRRALKILCAAPTAWSSGREVLDSIVEGLNEQRAGREEGQEQEEGEEVERLRISVPRRIAAQVGMAFSKLSENMSSSSRGSGYSRQTQISSFAPGTAGWHAPQGSTRKRRAGRRLSRSSLSLKRAG